MASGRNNGKRTNTGKRGSYFAPLERYWHRSGPIKRVGSVFAGILATICVLALVMGLIRVVQWHVEVKEAKQRQAQLAQEYDFNPGNIISDEQFFNADAMNEAEINAFITNPKRSCASSDCLAARNFDTENIASDDLCEAYQSGGKESAGTIIYKSAQACGVSPAVLITVLQKEQHLVSPNPGTEFQFKAAMGLSCPDDAKCDPKYAGFFRQVFGAAKRFKYYQKHNDQYRYHPNDLNYVQFNPNAACGGTQVYISNSATALLYNYTPYQPNDAALRAGFGEGDSCSAYGNRNFALIYANWFGDPRK